MRKLRYLLVLYIALMFCSIHTPVLAAQIGTNAATVWDYGSDSDPNNGSAGVVSSYSYFPFAPDMLWARAAGDAAGGNISARAWYGSDDMQNMIGTARVDWEETYTIGAAGAYDWNFTIKDGRLFVDEGVDTVAPTRASYDISIFVNGVEGWDSFYELQVNNGIYSQIKQGTDIGGTPLALASGREVTFGTHNDSLDLGLFNSGEAVTIRYILEVEVSGTAFGHSAEAFIGDPNNLTGTGLFGGQLIQTGGAPPGPIPEPSAFVLLAFGLLVLAGLGRKKRFK